ncbi:hypothetical protein Avbf_14805 [Armadillidium vulgare]|nr:hypothetical protein Avbf_14805 [Armadillidium vulgare]
MQTHVQNKKVKCPHCEFKTRFGHEELKEHLKSHTDTTTYQCEHCNFITNRYQTLQRHELKNHFKSSSLYIDEDSSSQSKKIVKKCNPYKSRKRSIISKKWMAKRKQKGIPLVAKEAKSCEDNENANSPTCSRNENRSPESKEERLPTFDSPKIKSPSFEGFAETKEAPSDACETSNAPSTGTSSSLKTQSCSTSTPTSSTSTISNTPPIQTSESEIANVSTYVTTNTSTTLTTIYSKVVSNTSTTLCLVNAVSLPTVSEFDPLSTNPSVSGIQPFSLQKNNYQSPVILSNSTEEANEEPFLLPKVTNVCGKVPFSSTSTLSTCAERVTDPLQNLNSIASSEFSSPNSNADLNGPSPFVPQTICNESIHKTSLVEDVQE